MRDSARAALSVGKSRINDKASGFRQTLDEVRKRPESQKKQAPERTENPNTEKPKAHAETDRTATERSDQPRDDVRSEGDVDAQINEEPVILDSQPEETAVEAAPTESEPATPTAQQSTDSAHNSTTAQSKQTPEPVAPTKSVGTINPTIAPQQNAGSTPIDARAKEFDQSKPVIVEAPRAGAQVQSIAAPTAAPAQDQINQAGPTVRVALESVATSQSSEAPSPTPAPIQASTSGLSIESIPQTTGQRSTPIQQSVSTLDAASTLSANLVQAKQTTTTDSSTEAPTRAQSKTDNKSVRVQPDSQIENQSQRQSQPTAPKSTESAQQTFSVELPKNAGTATAPQAASSAPAPISVPSEQQPTDANSRQQQQPHQRNSTSSESQRGIAVDQQSNLTPAASRAMQIDAAVQLENATAQQAADGATSRSQAHPASIAHHAINAVNATSNQVDSLQLPLPGLEGDDATDAPLPSRIIRGLAAMVNQRGGTMTMRLDPPDMGELRVQMTIARGVVSAEFQAGTQQIQAMLDKNLTALRSALEGQGLTVDRLTVHLAPPHASSQQSMTDDRGNNQNHAQRQSHDAAGGESRGRHEQSGQDSTKNHRGSSFERVFDSTDLFDLQAEFAARR